jgi:vancomycin permeability regulator SanA
MYNIYRKFKTTIKQRWIIKDNPPENPDCFIIPSYALVDRNTPTRPTRAEIKLAISWWQKFPQSYLLMSTGDNQNLGIDNSKVMAAYAQRLGVRPHNILEENRSLTTYQNLLYSLEIIKKNNFL